MRNIFKALTLLLLVSSAVYGDSINPTFITVIASLMPQPQPVEGDFYTLDSNASTQMPDGSGFGFGFTTAGNVCIFHGITAPRCGASAFTDDCLLQGEWGLYFVWNIWRCQHLFR